MEAVAFRFGVQPGDVDELENGPCAAVRGRDTMSGRIHTSKRMQSSHESLCEMDGASGWSFFLGVPPPF